VSLRDCILLLFIQLLGFTIIVRGEQNHRTDSKSTLKKSKLLVEHDSSLYTITERDKDKVGIVSNTDMITEKSPGHYTASKNLSNSKFDTLFSISKETNINPLSKIDRNQKSVSLISTENTFSPTHKTQSDSIETLSAESQKSLSQQTLPIESSFWKSSSKVSGLKKENRKPSRSSRWVSTIINRHSSEIQDCYQTILKLNPTIKGKIKIRIFVSPSGSVSEVQVISSTLGNSVLETMIVKSIGKWDDFGVCEATIGQKVYVQEYVFGE